MSDMELFEYLGIEEDDDDDGEAEWDEADHGDSFHDFVRAHVLREDYADMSDEEIDSILSEATAGLTDEEADLLYHEIFGALARAVPALARAVPAITRGISTVRRVAGRAAPMLRGLRGLMGRGRGRRAPRRPPARRPMRRPAPMPHRAAPARMPMQGRVTIPSQTVSQNASSAAMALILMNTTMFQLAMFRQMFGPFARPNIQLRPRGPSVPVGSMTNLASSLLAEVAIEGNAFTSQSDPGVPAYLLDESGELRGDIDIHNPEERAAEVLALVREAWAEEGPASESGYDPLDEEDAAEALLEALDIGDID